MGVHPQVGLSPTETKAEYRALSMALRNFIPVMNVHNEMKGQHFQM
jgi:hypothetical protein